MTLSSSFLTLEQGGFGTGWATKLDSVSATPLEKLGAVRWENHPTLGLRGFQYLRCFQSGGDTAGQVQSYIDPVSIANISAGTTTTITTTGLTADLYVGAILRCIDDAGGAGAAPEGESGRIIANTTTVITIHPDDAFSAAPAANDDFYILVPWGVEDSAANDEAAQVAGVSMANKDQYDYGWYQFFGTHLAVDAVAAGTTIPALESVIAGTALVTDGAGAAVDKLIGFHPIQLTTDTVLRKTIVQLYCGVAFKLGTTTA